MAVNGVIGKGAKPASRTGVPAIPWSAWATCALFLLIAAFGVWFRPAISIGETRYLTVAWNMWLTNNHLVPHLDGAAYGDKPPVLFIAIEKAWDLFGPVEFVGRMVPPLITAACFPLIAAAARLMWPERAAIAVTAPPLLFSFAIFTILGQAVMFDGPMTFWALAGLTGLLLAARGRMVAGFALFAAAIGLGLLTKGPVILTFILSAALLYPLWRDPESAMPSYARWYAATGAAFLAGAVIGLAWALAAIGATSEGFGFEILWRQTAGRVVTSFAHQKAWWFYFAFLPVIVFPWFFWSETWSRTRWRGASGEWPVRLLVTAALAVLVIMTLVSAKRFNYLLPLYPMLALMTARLLDGGGSDLGRNLTWLAIAVGGLALAAGAAGLGEPYVPAYALDTVSWWLGPAWLALAAGFWLVQWIGRAELYAWAFASLAAALLVVTQLGLWQLFERLDAHKVMAAIPNPAEAPLALYGGHEGEFGYIARRRDPVRSIRSLEAMREWGARHPDGYIIARTDRVRNETRMPPEEIVPFRHFRYGIWKAGRF